MLLRPVNLSDYTTMDDWEGVAHGTHNQWFFGFHGQSYIGEVDGIPVSWGHISPWPSKDSPTHDMLGWYVAPGHRGKGYGTQTGWHLRELTTRPITCRVSTANKASENIARHLGLHRTDPYGTIDKFHTENAVFPYEQEVIFYWF